MNKKIITARRFANIYLVSIIILTLILIGILYKIYITYLSFIMLIFISVILLPVVVLFFILLGWIYQPLTSRYRTWSRGAKGEEMVAEHLEKLGNKYLIFNDIMLPEEKGNIDHIVIGKNGIFIIETKMHKGLISCVGDEWIQEKIGRRGTRYQGKIGNPSKQIKRKAIVLRKFLKEKYPKLSDIWINAIIVFTNEDATIEVINPTVPILSLGNLTRFIKNNKSKIELSEEDISKLRNLFEEIE